MNRNLILLAFSLVTWGTGESMFLYFQPLDLQKLGADPVKIGVILGLAAVASIFVHIPAGYLADRFGRRPLIWSSWIIVFSLAVMLAPPLAGYLYAIKPALPYSVSFGSILLTLVLLVFYYYRPHPLLQPREENGMETQ